MSTPPAEWLLSEFWPTVLEKERKFYEKLQFRFNKKFGFQAFQKYLNKFRENFSRLWWGLGFAYALGLNKEILLKNFFGIPRHNTIKSPPYEVFQTPDTVDQKMHEMHLKKVKEGKMIQVPESYVKGVMKNFLVDEKDKFREIVDGFTENYLHPSQSLKMCTIDDLLILPQFSICMPLDAKSAFDQIALTPSTTPWNGQTSFDAEGKQHYFVNLGLPMGVCYGPNRCQGALKKIVNPAGECLHSLKLYIDDLLPVFHNGTSSREDLEITSKTFLMTLHKLGVKLSEKSMPQLTRAPNFLGFVMDFKSMTYVPQAKHLYKIGNIIKNLLDINTPSTFTDVLSLKGCCNFIFGPKGPPMFHEVDEFIRASYYIKGQNIEDLLKIPIAPNPAIFALLSKLSENFQSLADISHMTNSPSKDIRNTVIIVSDANANKAGAFCLFNGKDMDPNPTQDPQWTFSERMQNIASDYRESMWKELLWSSTDYERTAILAYLKRKFIPLWKQKFPNGLPDTEILFFSDSQPLIFQLNKILNPHPKANKEVKEIRSLLLNITPHVQFIWHRRNKPLAKIADAFTREPGISISKDNLSRLLSFYEASTLEAPLSPEQLDKVQIFDPNYLMNLDIKSNSTRLIFPNPQTANTQLVTILEFLAIRQSKGILILPHIPWFFSRLRDPHFSEPLPLGKLRPSNFTRIPPRLSKKHFEMMAWRINLA